MHLLFLFLLSLSLITGGCTGMQPTVRTFSTSDATGVTLRCFLGVVEITENVTWTKNGWEFSAATVQDTDSARIMFTPSQVTINPVVPEDEGMYRCNGGSPLNFTSK